MHTRVSVYGSLVRMTLVFKLRPLPSSSFHSLLSSVSISSLKRKSLLIHFSLTLLYLVCLLFVRLWCPPGFLFQVDTHTHTRLLKLRRLPVCHLPPSQAASLQPWRITKLNLIPFIWFAFFEIPDSSFQQRVAADASV